MAHSLKCGKVLRLYSHSRQFPKCLSSTAAERKGIVLGVYTDEKNNVVELTPSTEQYNKITQGKLLEQISLSVFF